MKQSTNQLYPGLPHYEGPLRGYFTCIHHAERIIEWSEDVRERVLFIQQNKEDHEIAIRLRHMVFLDPGRFPYDGIDSSFIQKNIQSLTAYLYQHVPECKWDGRELMFPKKIDWGDGNGNGDGYGDGDGNGYGNGYGDGDGDGNGNGYGDGYGNGDG